MDFSKKKLGRVLAYVALFLCAGFLNAVDHIPESVWFKWPLWTALHGDEWFIWTVLHCGVLSALLIEVGYMQWYLSVHRRFPQKQMRNNVGRFAVFFILLSILRVAKYDFVSLGGTVARYLWYAYYTPLTFGPLFMFYAALYFGKADDYKISKQWYWLFLPAVLLSVGILTNDLHQLAFRFPNGIENWEVGYTHGILYYLAFGWSALGVLSVIGMMIRSSYNRRLLKTLWVPGVVLLLMAIYPLLYAYPGQNYTLLLKAFGMNDFICISVIALWGSLVVARVIVPNDDYPAIFAVSSLNAGLADTAFQVRQTSATGIRPKPEQIEKARNGALVLPDGDTLLKARPVSGGWFYWTEDISELRRLKEELEDTADYLTEENAMIRLSAELEEGRRQTLAQTQLYDSVTQSLRPQLDTLSKWVQQFPAEDEAFCAALKNMAVLLAYCKRRSNLLLQAQAHPVLNGEDLRFCFEESAKALRLAEISCKISVMPELTLSARSAVAVYEAFESVIEHVLPVLSAVEAEIARRDVHVLEVTLTVTLREEAMPSEAFQALKTAMESVKRQTDNEEVRFVLISKNTGGGSDLCF